MLDKIVTNDLADFGYREIEMARDLLTAYLDNNNAKYLTPNGLQICLNLHSGYVFLTDEDYNVAMECDGALEDWFSSPYEGREGFLTELLDERDDMHPEDQEWLDQISE